MPTLALQACVRARPLRTGNALLPHACQSAYARLGTDSLLAAIRSLGNYKGEPQAAAVLYKIMTTERSSVATKSRAHLSRRER